MAGCPIDEGAGFVRQSDGRFMATVGVDTCSASHWFIVAQRATSHSSCFLLSGRSTARVVRGLRAERPEAVRLAQR